MKPSRLISPNQWLERRLRPCLFLRRHYLSVKSGSLPSICSARAATSCIEAKLAGIAEQLDPQMQAAALAASAPLRVLDQLGVDVVRDADQAGGS